MAAAASKKGYDGPDRRTHPASDRRHNIFGCCFEHSGMLERISTIETKTDSLESKKFLSSEDYWRSTAILVSIVVAILSASVYFSFQAGQALREIQAAQATISLQISYLLGDVKELKGKMANKNR